MEITKEAFVDVMRHYFESPNVMDSNLEPANLVDTTGNLAKAMHRIATALESIAASMDEGGSI